MYCGCGAEYCGHSAVHLVIVQYINVGGGAVYRGCGAAYCGAGYCGCDAENCGFGAVYCGAVYCGAICHGLCSTLTSETNKFKQNKLFIQFSNILFHGFHFQCTMS